MPITIHILSFVTSALFLYYGAACLWSQTMIEEFERFGLARFRVLTGVLEILGAIGLAVGLFVPLIRVLAAFGLGALMTLVVIQRVQQRDSLVEMLQALVFAVITLWIAVYGVSEVAA